jgi:hypothetical protein
MYSVSVIIGVLPFAHYDDADNAIIFMATAAMAPQISVTIKSRNSSPEPLFPHPETRLI